MSSTSNGAQLVRKSASGDASQLTGSSDGTVSVFRIGSYNVDVDQSKLTSENAKAVLDKVENIITTCVKNLGLHIMNLCEFGGHLQGLSKDFLILKTWTSLMVHKRLRSASTATT